MPQSSPARLCRCALARSHGASSTTRAALSRAIASLALLQAPNGSGAALQGGTAAFAEQVRGAGGELIHTDPKALLARL